jgi:hypothetical protein
MRFASVVIVLGLVATATAQPASEDTPTTAPVSPNVTPVAPVEQQPQLVRQEIVYEVDPGAARKRTALWLFISGSTLVLTSNQLSWYEKTQYEHALGSGPTYTAAQADAANHAKDITRYVATPLFLAGVAGIGAAAYMYFTAAKSERVHKTVWLPAVDGGQVGVAVAGRF